MKNKFLELQKLAEDWKQFSNENYGWKTKEYLKDGMRVWCYFDDTGRAAAVEFGNIQVSFLKQVEFDYITLDDLDRLDEIIEKYRRFLEEVKAKKERRQNENKQNI